MSNFMKPCQVRYYTNCQHHKKKKKEEEDKLYTQTQNLTVSNPMRTFKKRIS